jgi:LacI family transcriptional regulator
LDEARQTMLQLQQGFSAHFGKMVPNDSKDIRSMRVRLEDVAAAAGVSMKTVSRVLNQEPRVSEDTRQRVQEVVDRLQYKPNLSARSLASRRTFVVALAYDNPSRWHR